MRSRGITEGHSDENISYRMPGGMNRDELVALLAAVVSSARLSGIEITVFNPALDPSGAIGHTFADVLVEGLASAP